MKKEMKEKGLKRFEEMLKKVEETKDFTTKIAYKDFAYGMLLMMKELDLIPTEEFCELYERI